MRQDEAVETVQHVGAVKRKTESALRDFWFPFVVFGALTLLSTPFFYLLNGAGLGIFWLVAAPVGMVLVARYYRNRQQESGLETSATPYIVTAIGIAVGCFATGFIGGALDIEALAQLGPPLVIAGGYLVFAALERSVTIALVSVVLMGLAVVVGALDVDEPFLVTNLALGVVLTLTGLASWESRKDLR